MSYLLISNRDDMLPFSLDRDEWHHTMHKFNLIRNNNGFLKRDRFVEDIKGVLYFANNSGFSYNERKVRGAKYICYPLLTKLIANSDKFSMFVSVMNSLKEDYKQFVDYVWCVIDSKRIFYSWNGDEEYDTESFIIKNRSKGNDGRGSKLFITEGSDFDGSSLVFGNSLCNVYYGKNLIVREYMGNYTGDSECVSVLFLGSKVFVSKFPKTGTTVINSGTCIEYPICASKNYYEYGASDNYESTYDIPKEVIDAAKKVKKTVGINYISVVFSKKDDQYYFSNFELYPSVGENECVKKEFSKYVNSKMEYIEKKIKEKGL